MTRPVEGAEDWPYTGVLKTPVAATAAAAVAVFFKKSRRVSPPVIGMLAATIMPALSKAKQRSVQAGCMSNLKQIGIAMQLFVNDNEDVLPGPAFSGARASYDKNSSTELIWYIADYLDSQSPNTV